MTFEVYHQHYSDVDYNRHLVGYDVSGDSPSSEEFDESIRTARLERDSNGDIYIFGDYKPQKYDSNFNKQWENDSVGVSLGGAPHVGGISVNHPDYVVYVGISGGYVDYVVLDKSNGNIIVEGYNAVPNTASSPIAAINKDTFYIGYIGKYGDGIGVREFDYNGNEVNDFTTGKLLENDLTQDQRISMCRRGKEGGVATVVTLQGDGSFDAEQGYLTIGFDENLNEVGSFEYTTSSNFNGYKSAITSNESHIRGFTPSTGGKSFKIPVDYSNFEKTFGSVPTHNADATPNYVVAGEGSSIAKFDKDLNKIWSFTGDGDISLGGTYPRVGTSAWGPSVTTVTATQTSATSKTASGGISQFGLSGAQVGSTATQNTPTLTPVTTLTSTQVASQATPLQADSTELVVSVLASQVESSSTVSNGSVDLSLDSSQPEALSGVNTASLLERIGAVSVDVAATLNGASLSNLPLTAAQITKTADMNTPSVLARLALSSTQATVSSTENDALVNLSLDSTQPFVSYSDDQVTTSLSLNASQESASSSVNVGSLSGLLIDSVNVSSKTSMEMPILTPTTVVTSTQAAVPVTENDTFLDMSLASSQVSTPVFTAAPDTLFTSFIDVSQVQVDALMNGAFASDIKGVQPTVLSEMNTADVYPFVDAPAVVLTPDVTLRDANSVIGQGERSALFTSFAAVSRAFETTQAQTSGQKVQVFKDASITQATGNSETTSTTLFPLEQITETDAAPSVYPLDSVLVEFEATVISSNGIYTVPVQSELVGVANGVRPTASRRQGFNINNNISEPSELVSVASKVTEADISVIVTRQYGDRTGVRSGD